MGAITFLGTGSSAVRQSPSPIAVSYPSATFQEEDLHLLCVQHKRATVSVGITANADGWEPGLVNQTVGTGTVAVDNGPLRLSFWSKPYDAEELLPSVALSGGTTADALTAFIISYRPTAGERIVVTPVGTGSDTSSGTSFSAVVGSTDLELQDLFYFISALTSDSAATSNRLATASSGELGIPASRLNRVNPNGNDLNTSTHEQKVIAASPMATITVTNTLSIASTGGAMGIKLRGVPIPSQGKVVVDGVKKDVAAKNVIVGGQKKTIVNQWVVVNGQKKLLV